MVIGVCFFWLFFLIDSGLGLESGVFVATLAAGSPAAKDCNLTIGDRLLAVSMITEKFIICLIKACLLSRDGCGL